jgi:hypothetical protein
MGIRDHVEVGLDQARHGSIVGLSFGSAPPHERQR